MESHLLPGTFHQDPADRFIVATARIHNMLLATNDKRTLEYAASGHVKTACSVTSSPEGLPPSISRYQSGGRFPRSVGFSNQAGAVFLQFEGRPVNKRLLAHEDVACYSIYVSYIGWTMKAISVFVSESDYRAFRQAAAAENRPVAQLLREAMAFYRAERLEKRTPLRELPVLAGHQPVGELPTRAEVYEEILRRA